MPEDTCLGLHCFLPLMKDHPSSKTTICVNHRVVSQEGDYCKWFFCYLLPYFLRTLYLTYIGGRERNKMASASTPSANKPAKDHILVHTVQLKPIIKAQISGKLLSSGIKTSISFNLPFVCLNITTNIPF